MRCLTLTCNLLAETTYTFDEWREGATQRARTESFQVGGKGINVTQMLQRLGVDSLALFFPGGINGARCTTWLDVNRIPHLAFPVPAETRTGAVIRAPQRTETTFLGAENVIDGAAIEACAQFLDAQPTDLLLAISGSIPDWENQAWSSLREALERWLPRGGLLVDTYGPPLVWFARRSVAVVKINRKEFAGLARLPVREATDERMPELLARVGGDSPVQRWVITDGPNLVWMRDRDGRVTCAAPPHIEEISPTGSGDVFFAGLIHALFVQNRTLAEAVDFALPLGAANAASPGVADFDLRTFGFA